MKWLGCLSIVVSLGCAAMNGVAFAEAGASWSGIYPHLAFFNQESECGTGALVPWAGKLWALTYAPHKPGGSSDKLYEIDADLNQTIRPESVGGTPANRMIHPESNQLFIGPYVINGEGGVRVIPPSVMYGRLTGNARHLTDPENKIYYATMEEGFYEVDVHSLAVKELYPDGNRADVKGSTLLPGYHGKGLYSGQDRLIYANNGEDSAAARSRPDVESGCLATWDGKDWTVVRRNQFTEVTGPGGLLGNADPANDPVWTIGWDHRSLILMVLDRGTWHSYRLPKASHAYDGAHGWNTEWPRIRDIGEDDLLMTMHGMFWRFPRTFSVADSSGIAPRSTYLKVVGDFCRWGERLVFGCDDTAKAEFLNSRKSKGNLAGPGQSQSNLWFVPPERIDHLGVPLGRGAVWLNDPVRADTPSDPFLFSGFDKRSVFFGSGDIGQPVGLSLEVDREGTGNWETLRKTELRENSYNWIGFSPDERGAWIRIRSDRDCSPLTAFFWYTNNDPGGTSLPPKFDGLGRLTGAYSGGLVRARGDNLRTLRFAASTARDGAVADQGLYELGADMKLSRVEDPENLQWMKDNVAIPGQVLAVDDASVLFIDDDGQRYRLPKGDPALDTPGQLGAERVDREVCTERDLFNAHGTFYELPAKNAGGFPKIRPIATHNLRINDYCSYRGLLIMTGVNPDTANHHIIRSEDGKAALWAGVVDDLWDLGKPRGHGGPWKDSPVRSGNASDPYLMTGYDKKALTLSHEARESVRFLAEIDFTGSGDWSFFKSFNVAPGTEDTYEFPDAFQAYWIRFTADKETTATAQLVYE